MTIQIILKFIYLISISFWVGSIFFFSFFAAPSIFKILPRNMAGDVVSDIFPKYYLVGYICGLLALISSFILDYFLLKHFRTVSFLKTIILIVMLCIFFYAGQVIRPEAHSQRNILRNTEETSTEYMSAQKRFRKLHAQSAVLNLTVFTFGIAMVFITAYTYRDQ